MFVLFVEGFHDDRYFNNILKNPNIKIYQYSNKKKEKVDKFIKSLDCMNSDYLFFSDSDGKTDESKKDELCTTYKKLNSKKIFIVRFEIESWYLAGISEKYCIKNKIKYLYSTDNVTKEQFDLIIALNRKTRLQIMLDFLENYELQLAKQRNYSLKDFFVKKGELIKAV